MYFPICTRELLYARQVFAWASQGILQCFADDMLRFLSIAGSRVETGV
jgi:hypothetical protein